MKNIFLLIALLLAAYAPAQIIHTIAGNGSISCGPDGVAATATSVHGPYGVAIDGAGNIYIAEIGGYRIRKVNTSGVISTIAGLCGVFGYSGDGGPATAALDFETADVALDGAGNVYFSDVGNFCVRKVNAAGIISTFAGTSTGGFSGDGGPATAANMYDPRGIAIDGPGNVYIADRGNGRIRKINTSGVISTFAGNGSFGYSGDGSPATAAAIGEPWYLTFDGAGNLYFTDYSNSLVRKISATGIISAVAGNGTAGYIDGCPATAAELNEPTGIALDGAGNIYVGDSHNHRIRKINTSGIISTYAGNGSPGFGGDGYAATAAMLYYPVGVATDAAGNVYIADGANSRIRVVTPVSIPVFDGGSPQSLVVCENSVGDSINLLFTVTDTDPGLTETYTVTVSPAHGAISAGGTATSGTSVAPTGWAYTPATGYSGLDSFVIQVGNGYNTASATVYVTVNPLPEAGAITGVATAVCVGATVTLTDTAAGGAWSSAATGIAAVVGSAGLTMTGEVTGLAAGIDTIYYSVTNSCGTAVASAVVTVNPLPVVGTITGPDTICISNSAELIDTTAGGMWLAGNTDATVTVGGIITGAISGIDTLFYSISNSCGADTAAKAVYVKECNEGVTSPGLPGKGPGPASKGEVKLLPNPARDVLNIEGAAGSTLSIYDVVGREVYRGVVAGSEQVVDIAGLVSGVYVVEIVDAAGYKVTKRLVVAQ